VAFGKLAFIQFSKGSTHPGMDQESTGLDDDENLIAVAMNKPRRTTLST
jgi:hypothetical protein